ncbi:MAG: M20/M25/M40 family metallo-hydrolase [Butyrivibrio sp.]|nr:M20/M25/M40 family metallo-hydrolase [Butyrivibrio sp.]
MREDIIQLTKELVKIPSINSTEGERHIGEYIEEYIRSIPYFKKHPDQVIVQELKNDELHRRNVLAILIGEKDNDGKTLLLHGHTDTVGLEGYGALEQYACDPDELHTRLLEVELPNDVKEDLLSGEYMFGRGACDMKDGDAVFLGILKDACEHPENLAGNIVVSFNPVEENLHTGIIEATDILLDLKKKYNLNYIMGINNDYICPLFPGDEVKTIYTGMVGKLLPCFYIQGKETHVGQCYEGVDASYLASELVHNIHLNHEYTDEYDGENCYPPSVLKMKDLKPWYNVQTAKEAFVYFNYFVHNQTIDVITEKLVKAAQKAFTDVFDKTNLETKWFSEANKDNTKCPEYSSKVFTYEELLQKAKEKDDFKDEKIEQLIADEIQNGCDKREAPIAVIRYLLQILGITSPCIVLYYAPPYCPHNTIQGEQEKIREELMTIADEISKKYNESFRFMRFYPSLSDSSYLKIDETKESLESLTKNFPGFELLFPLPINNIEKLSIPAVNFGGFGKDAHKWTERVNLKYTFEVLPKLIEKTIDFYLR